MNREPLDLAGALIKFGEASKEVAARIQMLVAAVNEMSAKALPCLPVWYHVQKHVRRINQIGGTD